MRRSISSIVIGLAAVFVAVVLLPYRSESAQVCAVSSGYHVPKIVDFACGEYHNLAIDSNGNLWQWGGKNSAKTTPTIVDPGHRFSSVSAGNDYTVAIDTSGNAYEWNNYGEPTIINNRSLTELCDGADLRLSYSEPIKDAAYIAQSGGSYTMHFLLNESGQLLCHKPYGKKTSNGVGSYRAISGLIRCNNAVTSYTYLSFLYVDTSGKIGVGYPTVNNYSSIPNIAGIDNAPVNLSSMIFPAPIG